MGRETFTDHEGNEAPDFEIEEVEDEGAEKEKKPGKAKDADADGDDDEAAAAKAKKAGEGDEEEIEDEDDVKARLEEIQAENEALKAGRIKDQLEKAQGEQEQADYLAKALGQKIDELRISLGEARKDEDHEKQAKIEGEIEKAKEAKANAEKLEQEARGKIDGLKQYAESGGGDSGGRPGSPRTGKAKDWVAKNKWYNDPENGPERSAVLFFDQQLIKEGYAPTTDRYFKELSKRMAKKFPNLNIRHLDGNPVVKSTRRPGGDGKAGVHGKPGTAGTQHTKSTRPTLEPADKVRMRRFGLDPANKNDVKHFLRAKAETAADEARRSEGN